MERRAFGTQGLEIRSEEERILSGTLVPYGSPTKIGHYTEEFRQGAFTGADPEQIPLLTGHAHAALPVGRTLSLTEEAHALTGEWRVAETQAGDEVMALARDGVPLSLSVGFRPVEDSWSPDRSRVTRVRAELGEVSVVGVGAYAEAKVTSVRADEQDHQRGAPRLLIARLLR
jgi:HK97 family phage prohead protease